MNDGSGGDAPKESLSCSIEFHVVLDLVQPEGGSEREAVGDNHSNEDPDMKIKLVLLGTTDSKFLLDSAGAAAVKAGGEVGAGVEAA